MKTEIYILSISQTDDYWSEDYTQCYATYDEAHAAMDSFIHAPLYQIWSQDNFDSAVVVHDTEYLKECVAEKHSDEEAFYEEGGAYFEYGEDYVNLQTKYLHYEVVISSHILDVNEYVKKEEPIAYKETPLW